MKKVNLNTRGNSMAGGKKSIRNFYEEMITEAIKNIGKTSEYGTTIDADFISVLEDRLNKLRY
jgi:hypothetical protein|tara:strand:+ start:560 stop:748 length:189 start_codon:yes stop_codon:yes gene_type:complete